MAEEILPDEVCASCGKVITRRARANVLDMKVLCTACYNREMEKRDREKRKAEEAKSREREHAAAEVAEQHAPPTAAQLAFADRLGIRIPPGATKWQVSDMITAAKDRQDAEESRPQRYATVAASSPASQSNLLWYGDMHCNSCGYRWVARRKNPPAKCASCGSHNIAVVKTPKRSSFGCLLVTLALFSGSVLAYLLGRFK